MSEEELNNEITKLTAIKSSLEKGIQERQTSLNAITSDLEAKYTEKTTLNTEVTNLTTTKQAVEQEITGKQNISIALDEEVKAKTAQKDALNAEVTSLSEAKGKEVKGKEAVIKKLDLEITTKTAQKESLSSEINTLNVTKTETESVIATNNTLKDNLVKEVSNLQSASAELANAIKTQEKQKLNLENNISLLKDRSGLYSNDIAGIGEDNKKQKGSYIGSIIVSFSITLLFIYILVCSVKNPMDLPQGVKDMFAGEPGILFATLLLMRISLVGTLFVLIFVFVNLTRGFVSQFIKTQEKMTAVRLLDFLVTRIGKDTSKLADADKLKFETDKLDRQNKILNEHLPDLIEYNPSSFDKLSNTKSPQEQALAIADAFKEGVKVTKK